ncbi:Ig-like domain-containing protein [Deinococcus irradiatisoli]|uniref:Ig-like domain-containing protein n=1 Tax=Deinococcus irradiatisoli TaxID=2202254 RepID=UPI0015E846AA|nr:Ig-like domain-containing protein [Deinococcus irradiatisoli]
MLASLTLSACTGSTTPTPDPGDTTPPSIVSVTPASGAVGVAKDSNIVVTFSEPMNQASAQAAFQSATLGASTITWNASGTVMTVNPNADLMYTSSGQTYSFQITNTATDLKGNPLSNPTSATFKTFRQLSATLPLKASTVGEISNTFAVNSVSADVVVGDLANNTSRRGFFGFDLTGLPADLNPVNVLAARVRMYVNTPIVGTPFTDLFQSCSGSFCLFQGKSVVMEHVAYGNTIAGSAYGIAPLSADLRGLTDETPCSGLVCLFVGTSTGWNASDISAWLKDDLTNRAARGNLSEVRLSFPKDTNGDNAADNIAVSNAGATKAQLVVTYLMP